MIKPGSMGKLATIASKVTLIHRWNKYFWYAWKL